MYKVRISRRKRNIGNRKILNEFLICIKSYPVILIRLSRQGTVILAVARSKQDNRLRRIVTQLFIDPEERRRMRLEHLVTLKSDPAPVRVVDQAVFVKITEARIKNIDHIVRSPFGKGCTKMQHFYMIFYYQTRFVKSGVNNISILLYESSLLPSIRNAKVSRLKRKEPAGHT